MSEIPDCLPDGIGEDSPGTLPIRIGVDVDRAIVLLQVGDRKELIGLPIAQALQVSANVMNKALFLLFGEGGPGTPESDQGQGGIGSPIL